MLTHQMAGAFVSQSLFIFAPNRPTYVLSTLLKYFWLKRKLFEKWVHLWTKVGKNYKKNLWFLLLDHFINVYISTIFLDWVLKFAVQFDNTYQLALVATHTTEYLVCIYAKPLNMGKFM